MKLIKEINGFINLQSTGVVYGFTSVSGQIGDEDYADVYGLTCYLQNLKKADVTSRLSKPLSFGLQNNRNLEVAALEISY